MRPGGFVIPTSRAWHDHGKQTDQPMVWLDGLDVPLVRLLDASFQEPANSDSQMVTRPAGDSLARFGNNLLPIDWQSRGKHSPVVSYPYARAREPLAALARSGEPGVCDGHALRHVTPGSRL